MKSYRAIQYAVLASSALSGLLPTFSAESERSAGGGRESNIPLDFVLSHRALDSTDRISISPEGRWVAYTVRVPAKPGVGDADARTSRVVFLTQVPTLRATAIGPAGNECWRPSFSPDGKYVAFYCEGEGGIHLWAHDVTNSVTRQISNAVLSPLPRQSDDPAWNSKSTEIFVPLLQAQPPAPHATAVQPEMAHVSTERAGRELNYGPESSTHEDDEATEQPIALGTISLKTGAVRVVVEPHALDPGPSLLQLSSTGEWLSYLSVSGLECAVVRVTDGSVRVVARQLRRVPGPDFLRPVCHWHPVRDQLFWIDGQQVWSLDLGRRGAEPRVVAPTLTDVTTWPLAFTPDGHSVVVGVRPLPLDDFRNPAPTALAVIQLAGGPPAVFPLPQGLYAQTAVLQTGAKLWQPQPELVTVLCQDSSTAQNSVVRVNLQTGSVMTLWQGFGELRPMGLPAQLGMLIGTFQDTNTPPNLYQFSPDFASRQRLTNIEPRIQEQPLRSIETFQVLVPRPSGTLAHATTAVLLPPGAKRGERLPTVVIQYPGSKLAHATASKFAGGVSGVSAPISILTNSGYAVLFVDGLIGPLDTEGNPAAEMADVVVPQVLHAVQLGYVDDTRVALVGQSAGAYGVAAIVSETHMFRAAVAIAGFYDLLGWRSYRTVIHRRMRGDPWADSKRYIANSPYHQVEKIHTPLLLIHGGSDPACPSEESRKLFGALKRLDRTAQLATYDGEGHVIYEWRTANAIDASRRIVEFLDRYLDVSRSGERVTSYGVSVEPYASK